MFEGIFEVIKDIVDEFTTSLSTTFSGTAFNSIMTKENFLWNFTGNQWLYFALVLTLIITLISLIYGFFRIIGGLVKC